MDERTHDFIYGPLYRLRTKFFILLAFMTVLGLLHFMDGRANDPHSLSDGEIKAIAQHYSFCWKSAGRYPHAGPILLQMDFNANGQMRTATLDPSIRARYNSDPAYREAADSAVADMIACGSKNIPEIFKKNDYALWQTILMETNNQKSAPRSIFTDLFPNLSRP